MPDLFELRVVSARKALGGSRYGARVALRDGKHVIKDGPFAETKERIAGFWIIQVASKEEAIGWARRIPFQAGTVEIRQVFDVSDFPSDILPPDEAAREQQWRDDQAKKAAAKP